MEGTPRSRRAPERERDPAPPMPQASKGGPVPATAPVSEPLAVRIGRAERDTAEQRLRQALADDIITINEYDERCGVVMGAQTQQQLDAVLADLPAPPEPEPGPYKPTREQPTVTAILSGNEQRGYWRPAKPLRAFAFLGEAKVDLRNAESDDGEYVVEANSLMGRVEIIVPDGADIDLGGIAIAGERTNQVPGPALAAGPVVRVRGVTAMGSLEVRTATKKERKRYPVAERVPPPLPSAPAAKKDQSRRNRGRIAAAIIGGLLLLGPGRAFVTADARAIFGSDTYRPSVEQLQDGNDIDVFVMFGSVDVAIPPGVAVDNDVISLFGSDDCDPAVCEAPGDVQIDVDGWVLFGSADISLAEGAG